MKEHRMNRGLEFGRIILQKVGKIREMIRETPGQLSAGVNFPM